jgi:hypothetical protein
LVLDARFFAMLITGAKIAEIEATTRKLHELVLSGIIKNN